MAIKRHKPEEIVAKLRQVEVLVGRGMARIDAIREISITEQTYYRWRKQYGGRVVRDQYSISLGSADVSYGTARRVSRAGLA